MNIITLNKHIEEGLSAKIQVFLNKHPYNTIFQSPAWFSFYLKVKNTDPLYFIVIDQDQNIKGIMLAVMISESNSLLKYISRRCVIYGGPIIENDEPEVLQLLLHTMNQKITFRALFTQFRNFREWNSNQKAAFEKNGFVYRDRLNLLVPIALKQSLWQGLSNNRKRQINKGIEKGVRYRPVSTIDEVKIFYEMLRQLYRTKVRKPLPPWSFFENFFFEAIPKKNGVLLLVEYNKNIVGGILCPLTSAQTIAELYVCGLDHQFPEAHPSAMATWAAMEWGNENGFQQFDFMGLGKPGVPYGVREFKRRFGGNEVNFGRFARRNLPLLYHIAELGYNVLRIFRKV